jgi:hypothetical protein
VLRALRGECAGLGHLANRAKVLGGLLVRFAGCMGVGCSIRIDRFFSASTNRVFGFRVTLFGSSGYTVGVTGTPVGSSVLRLAVRKCYTSSTGPPIAWRTLRFSVHDRFGC